MAGDDDLAVILDENGPRFVEAAVEIRGDRAPAEARVQDAIGVVAFDAKSS